MQKILVIPDLHEKDCWKERIKDGDFDKVVFLGDYVDSWTHDDEICISNLKDIIAYKELKEDKCVLLLGNHDVQYLYPEYRCSGYQNSSKYRLKEVFSNYRHLFKIAHLEETTLFSHAGVSEGWMDKHKEVYESFTHGNIDDKLNAMFDRSSTRDIICEVGPLSGGYSKEKAGPLWLRPQEYEGIIPGYHQVVGHTPHKKISISAVDENTSITYTDVLDRVKEYLVLEI